MKSKHLILVIMWTLSFFTKGRAQEIMTLEQAVKIALENNYDIKLVSNQSKINQNNVSWGAAGFLPGLSANLVDNNSILNSRVVRIDGPIQERTAAKSTNLNYGVGFTWTVFDGFAMFARYDRYKEIQKLGQQDLQLTLLTKVSDVMSFYYNLVLQQQQLRALDSAMRISRIRLITAENRFEIGKAAKLEVLNASVDLNTDTTNLLRQKELYNNTRIQLNEVLARDVNTLFVVTDTITIDNQLVLDNLLTQAQQQNPSLQSALINQRVALLNKKLIQSFRYPVVTLNSGYTFNRSTSAVGFSSQSTSSGLTYGVTASLNLFGGFVQHRNEMNATLLVKNSELQADKLKQNLNTQLSTSYQTYQTNLALVKLEEVNQRIAKQNLDISLDKLNLGSISPVEIRTAQLNYVNATVRYSNALYNAKMAEVTLKEISGTLSF